MNRLGKILTLGLEKKRAWQLPLIAGLLVLFGLGVRWWYNSRAVRTLDLVKLVEIGDIDGVRYVCKWDKQQVNQEGEISRAYKGLKEPYTSEYYPLLLAVRKNYTGIVKALIEAGATVNCKDKYGRTPLHCAADYGHIETAKMLIEAGAKVNAKDKDGCTPLYWAVLHGDTKMAKVLIDTGADINTKSRLGNTPLNMTRYARPFIHPKDLAKCTQLLRKHGAKKSLEIDYPLHYAAQIGRVDIVRTLVESGTNVNTKIKSGSHLDGQTPLHKAAWYGQIQVAKVLLAVGAKVNAKDKDGRMPLHDAAMQGYTEVVKILLEAGADVNARDKHGRAPLHWPHAEEMKDLLRKHGAKYGWELRAEEKQGKQ